MISKGTSSLSIILDYRLTMKSKCCLRGAASVASVSLRGAGSVASVSLRRAPSPPFIQHLVGEPGSRRYWSVGGGRTYYSPLLPSLWSRQWVQSGLATQISLVLPSRLRPRKRDTAVLCPFTRDTAVLCAFTKPRAYSGGLHNPQTKQKLAGLLNKQLLLKKQDWSRCC